MWSSRVVNYVFGVHRAQGNERGVEGFEELLVRHIDVAHVQGELGPWHSIRLQLVDWLEMHGVVMQTSEIGDRGNVAVVSRREELLRRLSLESGRLERRIRFDQKESVA